MATEKKMTESESKVEKETTPVTGIFAGLIQDDIDMTEENFAPQPIEEKKAEDYTYLRLYREKFTISGKDVEYWGYYIAGKMYGKVVRATMKMDDKRGYDLLDLMFNATAVVGVRSVAYANRDEATGQIRKGFTYEACADDGNGEMISVKIKPVNTSDKAIAEYLYRTAEKKQG